MSGDVRLQVSCPHCRRLYHFRIDRERLQRLRESKRMMARCGRCQKQFMLAYRLGVVEAIVGGDVAEAPASHPRTGVARRATSAAPPARAEAPRPPPVSTPIGAISRSRSAPPVAGDDELEAALDATQTPPPLPSAPSRRSTPARESVPPPQIPPQQPAPAPALEIPSEPVDLDQPIVVMSSDEWLLRADPGLATLSATSSDSSRALEWLLFPGP